MKINNSEGSIVSQTLENCLTPFIANWIPLQNQSDQRLIYFQHLRKSHRPLLPNLAVMHLYILQRIVNPQRLTYTYRCNIRQCIIPQQYVAQHFILGQCLCYLNASLVINRAVNQAENIQFLAFFDDFRQMLRSIRPQLLVCVPNKLLEAIEFHLFNSFQEDLTTGRAQVVMGENDIL